MPRPGFEDRFDSTIAYYWDETARRFKFDASVDWRLYKAVIKQESAFKADAKNPRSGALGLPQMMEREDLAIDGKRDADNPEEGIKEGLIILAGKWSIFKAETGLERWHFALGAYNGGERDIIRAQAILKDRGLPTDQWMCIAMVLPELKSAANADENRHYVRRVMDNYARYLTAPNLFAD